MPALKSLARAYQRGSRREEWEQAQKAEDTVDAIGSMIKQIQDFRQDCEETAKDLRLLDLQLDGVTKGQDR